MARLLPSSLWARMRLRAVILLIPRWLGDALESVLGEGDEIARTLLVRARDQSRRLGPVVS